ncbi:MAG TPA: sigma-54-dependent Fis family transcriptional regulator [Polyangiaceae bacterium]|nr:sigma-54-dependent Fis family transcriptional regulator [Polyangiaceae bacterium]
MSIEDLTAERDLYRGLLELGQQERVEPLLANALELVTGLARAERGYLEIDNPYAPEAPAQYIAHGLDEEDEADGIEAFQKAISSGVIQKALAQGCTIVTASAMTDVRFAELESVKDHRIEAVLCAPIGKPPFGVLYLQGRQDPGPFRAEDQRRAELCAAQIASLAERLLLRAARSSDPTESVRGRLRLDDVIGTSPAIAKMLEDVSLAAPLDVSVMLLGATGTGKSHLASVIHRNSRRADGPFVEINCAALPETLIESELFGAAKGAHSTATEPREGKVAAAEGGTLFLDEVGELPITAQGKLLQLLQSRTYYPLGSASVRQANVRIVAATKRDLEQGIADKTFREDLYYRLQVLTVRIPALSERREDLRALAKHRCERAVATHGLPRVELSVAALHVIETTDWPGNVRQLFHAVEAGTIRAAGEGVSHVEPRHLFPADPELAEATSYTFQEATRRFQRDLVERTLQETGWNVSEAAKRLDVARSYLYKLIDAHGLERA